MLQYIIHNFPIHAEIVVWTSLFLMPVICLHGISGCDFNRSSETFLEASPMISKDFKHALLRILSPTRFCNSTAAQFSVRKSISSRMCLRSSLSLFRPDHILLHIWPDARVQSLDSDKIHLSSEEIFEIKGEVHEVAEGRLLELRQYVNVAGFLCSPREKEPKMPVRFTAKPDLISWMWLLRRSIVSMFNPAH